jgi:hypothetical protein
MKAETKLPDIYFLPEWGKLYEDHDHGEAGIFEFKNDLGHVYYQFMKRPLPDELDCKDYVDLVTPYGFNGPVILACEPARKESLAAAFDEAFQQYCLDNHFVSEYIRFSPWLRNHLDFEKIYSTKYNNYTFFTDLTVADFFLDEFSSKRRNQVRKAQKNEVQCEFDYSGATISEFSRIYELTVKKNNVSEYYLFRPDFLQKTFSALKSRQFIINARVEGKTISTAIFLHHGDYLHYHLCANDPEYYPLCANSLILYEAGKWGRANGKKQMHLGGAFSDELFAFKKQFTKKGICDYYVGKKIRDERMYRELLAIKMKKGKISNPDYFPLYRG